MMIRTKQREILLETIRTSETHPTADELFQRIRCELPMISLATIYRNLNYLVEEGIIRRISVPGMPDRFDRCLDAHDHMVCDRCGGIFDFELKMDLGAAIEQAVGGPVRSYSLFVHGCCPNCRDRNE